MNSYKLKELLSIKNGKDHKELNDGTIPIFGSGGVMRYGDKAIYDDESILLPRKGTLSNIQYVNEPFWTVDTIYYTVINKKLANPFYLYNYLKSLDLTKLNSGTGVPSMTFNSYYDLEINLPSLPTQRSIAKVLSDLDTKIELNNKINQELEAMAKTLYDYWFVQFDFPDDSGKPYKSSGGKMVYNEELKREIPEGWEVENLTKNSEIVDCLHSKKPDYQFKKDNFYLLQLNNIKDDGLIDISNKYYVSENDYKLWTSRIEVVKNDIVITNAGRVAATAQIPKEIVSGIGRNITAIRPNSISPTYLFMSFKGVDMKRQIAWNTDQGAFFTSLNVKGIKKLMVLRPFKSIEEEFENRVLFIRRKRELIQIENQQLSALRDWLLPMLMNGQVTVKESDFKEVQNEISKAAESIAKYGNSSS